MKKGRVIFVALFLVILTVPGYSQFAIEANLGFNLFSVSDPELKADASVPAIPLSGTAKGDVTFPTMLAFGAYGGYNLGAFEIGAEFAFFKGEGESKTISIDGNPIPDSAGDFDVQFIRIGPVFRYYFRTANPKLVPLAGAAVDYIMGKVDIPDPPLKFDQGYLDIGAFGGVLYFFQPNIYVGGVVRIDYYLTVGKDEITVEIDLPPVIEGTFKDITTSGWVPASIYAYIGYRL